jgi:tetratricopeptide (TPR) repeat protein
MEMMTSSKSESKKPKDSAPDINERTGRIANPIDLSSDPDYTKLLKHYQHAEFTKCKEVLDKLEKRYPEHPGLLKFKDDLQMKLSLKNIENSIKKGEKSKKKKAILNMSVFAIIVMIVFFFSYYYTNDIITVKQLEDETALLTSLNYQAEQLLLARQPQPAAEIIERIRTINPEFVNLPELISLTDDLLRLEANYQTALNLITENKNNEALVILNEIEAEKPAMWDVSQQIASIETSFQIAKYMEEGNAAYQVEKWDQVISAYENALILDSELDDPLMNEQLLKGYLNRIISMFEDENTSIEDTENAEEYYRRAVAMTSQSKAFASARGTLQKASSDLLELKFTQIAKANLEDKNQTETSIAKAVSYLRKAANIKPEDTALNSDLKNAEHYQIAFENFIEMNWEQAITYLNQVSSVDSNYANGNASLLLFEAYYALGKQYYSMGLYLDAIKTLEQAEILAWHDSGNMIKLFQVQVLLGDAIGKLNDYENAVSYYQYALNAIQVNERLTNFPTIATKLAEANVFVTYRNYEDAFYAFQEVLKGIDVVYSISEIEISDGVYLAFFANENLSTVNAVLEANNLPTSTAITFGRKLKVPMIEE